MMSSLRLLSEAFGLSPSPRSGIWAAYIIKAPGRLGRLGIVSDTYKTQASSPPSADPVIRIVTRPHLCRTPTTHQSLHSLDHRSLLLCHLHRDSNLTAHHYIYLPHLPSNMCFGGDRGEAVIIRKRERPRYHRDSYVSRPETATYRRETVTRRSTSAHRPSHDHHHHHHHHDHGHSRSRSRIVEERRSYYRD